MTHTPAPWHAGEPLLIGRYLIRDDAGEIVAEVVGLPWSEPETAANAELIASAPVLLARVAELEQANRAMAEVVEAARAWVAAEHASLQDAELSARDLYAAVRAIDAAAPAGVERK